MTLTQGGALARLPDAGPRYRVVKVLGEGSFGAVYRAQVVDSGQEVALKALTRVKPAALIAFKREFRALCQVNHPNLVGLRELFEHEGQWFITMDLVEGQDLLAWVRRGDNDPGYDEGRLRRAFAGVAQGLAALHAHGLLHRDLKPSNVRVTPEGKALLLDFGLVTMTDADLQSTQQGVVGTLAYMAPEQASGEKLGPTADLYALGASLYHALTGKLPLEADSTFALMLLKTSQDPPPPRHHREHFSRSRCVVHGAFGPKPTTAALARDRSAHAARSQRAAAFPGPDQQSRRRRERRRAVRRA